MCASDCHLLIVIMLSFQQPTIGIKNTEIVQSWLHDSRNILSNWEFLSRRSHTFYLCEPTQIKIAAMWILSFIQWAGCISIEWDARVIRLRSWCINHLNFSDVTSVRRWIVREYGSGPPAPYEILMASFNFVWIHSFSTILIDCAGRQLHRTSVLVFWFSNMRCLQLLRWCVAL